jgi:hypothetical protein
MKKNTKRVAKASAAAKRRPQAKRITVTKRRKPAKRITAAASKRGTKRTGRAAKAHAPAARVATQPRAKGSPKRPTQLQSRSVASLAASVLSRRAAKVEAQAAAPILAPVPVKVASRAGSKSRQPGHSKGARAGSAKPARLQGAASLPGNRPLVKAARMQQFNYMKAPGTDHGFDVGDSVEVFCDHELDSERVRGWVKGVVVQVDNKLVAVQFRSNVFLTDGWMVPDRILWYSLGSDQIRNMSLAKRAAPAVIPEY